MVIYRFGEFQLDSASGELKRAGQRVRIRPQPCAALIYLLDHAGRLVSRQELQAALWPDGTYVRFDDGLNSCIKQIRAALGDSRTRPRFLETFSRRGYRFVAPVSRRDDAGDSVDRDRLVLLKFVSLSTEAQAGALAAGIAEEVAVHLTKPALQSLIIWRFFGSEDDWFNENWHPFDRTADFLLGATVRYEAGAFRLTAQLVSARDRSLAWMDTIDGRVDALIETQAAVAAGLSSRVHSYLHEHRLADSAQPVLVLDHPGR